MKYSDMQGFTYAELSGMKYGQLQKTPQELIEHIHTYGSQIPYDTYSKLLKICDDINEQLKAEGLEPIEEPTTAPTSLQTYLKVLFFLIRNAKRLKETLELLIDAIFDLFFDL